MGWKKYCEPSEIVVAIFKLVYILTGDNFTINSDTGDVTLKKGLDTDAFSALVYRVCT